MLPSVRVQPLKPPDMTLNLDDVKFASRMSQSRIREALKLAEKLTTDPQQAARLQRQECPPCFYVPRMAGRAFTDYSCVLCGCDHQHNNTAVPRLCSSCAAANGLCVSCCADLNGEDAANTRTMPLTPMPSEDDPAQT